jgi:hypothetical protein
MKTFLTAFLLLPSLALAHAGHGKSGFSHEHTLGDLALALLGVAIVAAAGWAILRLVPKKKP